jgi:Dak1 domain
MNLNLVIILRSVATALCLTLSRPSLGMGIHNEPGFARIRPYPTLQKLVARLLNHLTSSIETDPERGFLSPSLQRDGKDQFVLLVNNLGSVSQLEMGGIVKEGQSYPTLLHVLSYARSKRMRIWECSLSMASKPRVHYSPSPVRNLHGEASDAEQLCLNLTEIIDQRESESRHPSTCWASV